MDQSAFESLVRHLRLAAPEVGLDPSSIVVDEASVVLEDTGVEVHWMYDALGTGRPGWQVREVYYRTDILTDEEGMRTDVVGCAAPDETYEVSRAAVLFAVDKRIEAAFDGIAV